MCSHTKVVMEIAEKPKLYGRSATIGSKDPSRGPGWAPSLSFSFTPLQLPLSESKAALLEVLYAIDYRHRTRRTHSHISDLADSVGQVAGSRS